MEIKELISFKTIVESGTFSKAADLLYYTQPTITNHIKQLEKSLGFKLFVRGWDAKLTRQGELLYSQLDNLLDHWNYFKGVASDIEKEEIGTLRIGVLEIYASQTADLIMDWTQENKPRMNIEFLLGNTEQMYNSLIQRKIDFAFSSEKEENHPKTKFSKIRDENFGFALPPSHPLLSKEIIQLSDILQYPIVIGDKTCITNRAFMKALDKNNLTGRLKQIFICSNQILIPDMVKSDRIAILPESLVINTNLNFFELEDLEMKLNYGIIVLKQRENYLSKTMKDIIKLFI